VRANSTASLPLTSWPRKLAAAILIVYWIALVAGTHVPHPPQLIFPRAITDKWLHLMAYAGLAFLLSLNWAMRRPWAWWHALALLGALAAFGAADEITQIPVGRDCDPIDWVADMVGATAGLAIFIAAWSVWRMAAVRRASPQ
jgi:VanZ family protein